MVAGEWGTMSHLQIYPTPSSTTGSAREVDSLQLAGYIRLDHKVNDIQGCDFLTAVRMICASDDDSRTLFKNEKPLLKVDLSHSLHGSSVTGHVVDLGSIPQESSCSGTFEAEGLISMQHRHVTGGDHPTRLLYSENDGLPVQADPSAVKLHFETMDLSDHALTVLGRTDQLDSSV